jgi:hypothetical protein
MKNCGRRHPTGRRKVARRLSRAATKVLFVKDGVRVSEVNLEPGAVTPSHHYDGPHLLVAVTDLDVRSDVEGMGPMPGKFKSGDVKWLPGGYTHTIDECGQESGKIRDGGILKCGVGVAACALARPSAQAGT